MYTSEADFHKLGIYGGSVRVWATAWDVFRRAPSRVGRGRRAAVDFVVCFGWGGFFSFFFPFFFFERTRPSASTRPPCLMYLSTRSFVVSCLIHLALPCDLVVVADLVHADDLAEHRGELVEEGLGHELEVAADSSRQIRREQVAPREAHRSFDDIHQCPSRPTTIDSQRQQPRSTSPQTTMKGRPWTTVAATAAAATAAAATAAAAAAVGA